MGPLGFDCTVGPHQNGYEAMEAFLGKCKLSAGRPTNTDANCFCSCWRDFKFETTIGLAI
jgi:hypothetical protein